MNYKLPKDIKYRMEREIRQYDHNKKRLVELMRNGKTPIRRMLYLQEKIQYIEVAYKRLKPVEQDIYNMIFKEGCNWLYCKSMYNVDKDTYYKVYNKSLYYLAEEWGEI